MSNDTNEFADRPQTAPLGDFGIHLLSLRDVIDQKANLFTSGAGPIERNESNRVVSTRAVELKLGFQDFALCGTLRKPVRPKFDGCGRKRKFREDFVGERSIGGEPE